MPMELQIDLLRGGLAVPLKIFTIVTLGSEQKNPPDAGGKSDRESTTRAALRNGKFQFLSSSSSFSSSPSNLFAVESTRPPFSRLTPTRSMRSLY